MLHRGRANQSTANGSVWLWKYGCSKWHCVNGKANSSDQAIHEKQGEDPDSFIRKSEPGKATQYINNGEIDFIEFKAQHKKEIEPDPTKKGELITEITNDISVVHDKKVRLIYILRVEDNPAFKEKGAKCSFFFKCRVRKYVNKHITINTISPLP